MKSIIGRAVVVRVLAASLSTSSPEDIGHREPNVVREDKRENI